MKLKIGLVTVIVATLGYAGFAALGSRQPASDARAKINAADALALASADTLATAVNADRDAASACQIAAKTQGATLPTDTAGFTAACRALKITFPFDPNSLDRMQAQAQSVRQWATQAEIIRCHVALKEAEQWRLPSVMETLSAQTGALLSAVADSKLAVKHEAVNEARRAFGMAEAKP